MRVFLIAAAAVLVLGVGGAAAEPRPPLRVLFVGNSLTAANDLPGTVAAFARAVGGRGIEVDSYAPGGYALQDHWADGVARSLIERGRFDAVVLQQGPSSLPASGVDLTTWTTRFADEARAFGVRPALLTVWPERSRSAFFPAVIAHHRRAAAAARAALFPAGEAWRDALARSPRLPLYGPDGFHPGRLGTYLTAAVVYTGLTGVVPRAFPRRVGGTAVGPAAARLLRATIGRAYAPRGAGLGTAAASVGGPGR